MSEISKKLVAESIDWLGGWADDDQIEFSSVDYSHANETGAVILEGEIDGKYVSVVLVIESVSVSYKMEDYDGLEPEDGDFE